MTSALIAATRTALAATSFAILASGFVALGRDVDGRLDRRVDSSVMNTSEIAKMTAISCMRVTPRSRLPTATMTATGSMDPHVALGAQRPDHALDRVVEAPEDGAATLGHGGLLSGDPGGQERLLPCLHRRGVVVALVVVAEQVQHAVDKQEVQLLFDGVTEFLGLTLRNLWRYHDIAQGDGLVRSDDRTRIVTGKREHIGRTRLAAIAALRSVISSSPTMAIDSSTASGASSRSEPNAATRSKALSRAAHALDDLAR